MKKENEKLEINGNMETVDFTIKTDNNKMFHLLSNLYSNPLGSTIREISTNCVDAHKINNNEDRPFIIRQSSRFDSDFYLSFRDFGPGMNHDDIKSIFCTFGKSTKDNSNDVVGCLGLGSKSPLSIADAFNVISINNGIKTIYNITKSSESIPQLIVFGSSETDEENGLEVKIPISDKYKNNIKNEILNQLMFFKQKPLYFIGSEEEKLNWQNNLERYYKMNDNIFIKKNTAIYNSFNNDIKDIYIIQGGIKYKFDKNTFLNSIEPVSDKRINERFNKDKMQAKKSDYNVIEKLLEEHSIYIFADIGNISFMPSRETIIYDTNTIEYIYKKFLSIIDKYQETYKKITSSLDCEWDKHVIINLNKFHNDMNIDEESRSFFGKMDTSLIKSYSNFLDFSIVGKTSQTDIIKYTELYDIRFMTRNNIINKYEDLYIGKRKDNEYYTIIFTLSRVSDNLSNVINFVFTPFSEKNSRMKINKYFMKKELDNKNIIFIRTIEEISKKKQVEYVNKMGFNQSRIINYSDICDEYEIISKQEKLKTKEKNKNVDKVKKIKKYQVSINKFNELSKLRKRRELDLTEFKGIKILTHQGRIIESTKISESSKYFELNKAYVLFNSFFLKDQLENNFEVIYLNKKDYNSKEAQHLKTLQEVYEEVLDNYKEFLSDKHVYRNQSYNDKFVNMINIFDQFINKKEGKDKFKDINDLFYKKDIEFIKQYNKHLKHQEDDYVEFECVSNSFLSDKDNIDKINNMFNINIEFPEETSRAIIEKINKDSHHFSELFYCSDIYYIDRFTKIIEDINKDLYIQQHAPSDLTSMHLREKTKG